MTAQTIAYLKANEFTLTGPPGRIIPQYMVDLIDTLRKRSSNYDITDQEYGAIGDGSSHPLSGITLWGGTNTTGFTANQWNTLLYGTTTPTLSGQSITVATTSEMDGVAFQLAGYTAAGAKGGLVTIAAGHYRMNQTIYMPPTQLVNNNTPVSSVNVLGDGRENTILEWSADLGTSTFAITCIGRTGATPASAGYWQDFTIVGPNAGVALGAKPANMHGFGWASARVCQRLGIIGFNGGICIPNGDQTNWTDVRTWNNYFGMYWDATNTGNATGDMWFDRFASNLNMRAAVGVANVCELNGSVFMKGFLGTSPYAVYKETGGANNVMWEDSLFIHTQFESIGNSAFGDGFVAGSHVATGNGLLGLDFCQITPNSAYKIAAEPATCLIGCSQHFGPIVIRNWTYLGNMVMTGYSSGIFEVNFPVAGIDISADLDSLLGTVLVGLPLGKSTSAVVGGGIRLHNYGNAVTGSGGGWEGTVCNANANPTLAIGNIVAGDSSGNRTVALSAGTTTEQILGIVVLPHTVSGGWVCVAQSGYAPRVLSSGALTNGHWVRAGASGLAVDSNTKFPTLSSNIGVWGNAAVTPNRGTCILSGIV